nr:MAG TPA: hypothetical protein [Caudoviricetes sp.]
MRRISTAHSNIWYHPSDLHSMPFWITLRKRFKQKLGSQTFIWDDQKKDWAYRITFVPYRGSTLLSICSAEQRAYLFSCKIYFRSSNWIEVKRFLKLIILLIERSIDESKTSCK